MVANQYCAIFGNPLFVVMVFDAAKVAPLSSLITSSGVSLANTAAQFMPLFSYSASSMSNCVRENREQLPVIVFPLISATLNNPSASEPSAEIGEWPESIGIMLIAARGLS